MPISYDQLVREHQGIELLANRMAKEIASVADGDALKLRGHLDQLIALAMDHLNTERELASQIERSEQTFYWGQRWSTIRELSDNLQSKCHKLSSEWRVQSICERRNDFAEAIRRFSAEFQEATNDEISIFYKRALERGLIPLR